MTDTVGTATSPGDTTAVDDGSRRRVRGVDVFRGFVLAFMLFTPPVRTEGTYPMLGHAPWLGWTFADLIFPAFLVTSGASLAFLLRPPTGPDRRRRLVRRTIALLVAGVFYNTVGGPLDLTEIRLTGVLQMIGLSGAIAAVAVLVLRRDDGSDRLRALAGVGAALLLAWAVVLVAAPTDCLSPDALCNPLHGLDVALLGRGHLYRGGAVPFDPEGISTTIVAATLPIMGYLAGTHIRTHRGDAQQTVRLLVVGVAVAASGLALSPLLPMGKRLLTPTFVLFAGGLAVAGIAATILAFDLPARRQGWVGPVRTIVAAPLVTLGWNALVVYLGERIFLVVTAQTMVGDVTLTDWILAHSPLPGDRAAFTYSLLLLATILAVTGLMRALRWRIAL